MSDRNIFIVFRSLDPRIVDGVPKVVSRCSRCGMAVTCSRASWEAAVQMDALAVCTHCLRPEEVEAAENLQPPTAEQLREIAAHFAGGNK